MKKSITFRIDNFSEFKVKMLHWANRFSIFCLLDNHQYNFDTPAFECMLAVASAPAVVATGDPVFEPLRPIAANNSDWLFGHICYDAKNDIEQLASANFDGIGFPEAVFFVPEKLLQLQQQKLIVYTDEDDAAGIFDAIQSCTVPVQPDATPVEIKSRMDKQQYIAAVQQLQAHILRGDCYEINFCQEFFAENAVINPVTVYQNLATLSPNPFAALYKFEDKYCICASPERYLKKTGDKVLSQPIKGTAIRKPYDAVSDQQNRKALLHSTKERSENVMVVDLVRNDLSKICVEGTVQVDELFGIYSFPQVHQMISTVSGQVQPGLTWVDMIKATFPMGSMTGAPKKRVMELIEQYEQTKRGLFSGTIGYIKPGGDFDFNVIIRSIVYNTSTRYLSFQTGSAITFYSDAAQEYEECLLKAAAIRQVLS
ncbi:MAG TPA: anthranilate synthase component I family protein [Ferruginibacter sp.]|nr:anthranilate synthase component I family protein [Ferruginibacter sp.]HMP19598.1 anthranilate synthase component I family protein [Ferruginibacter sp.]